MRCVSVQNALSQPAENTREKQRKTHVERETHVAGCGVRRIRTSLTYDRYTVLYAAAIWRHSARAAARLSLKRGLLERLRS